MPDFETVAREAIARLEREPLPLQIEGPDGPDTYILTADDMRRVVAGMIGRRFSIQFIPEDFGPIAAGDFSGMAQLFPRARTASESAMRAAMDCASGVSARRRRLIGEQMETSLLGTAADFPYPEVCDAWGVEDLGDDFRAPLRSSIPTLFISGDLDGRTPISNADEVMAGFSHSSHIVVEGVGHEGFIFFASPQLMPLIGAFMSGTMPAATRLPAPDLVFSPAPAR